MSKFLNYLGGVIGGLSLIYVLASELLQGLDHLLNIIGIIVVIVFAVALIINGARSLISKA
ncbi:hypothetical protein [Paenibacillus piri]|uniref:Uncharacterized protein n=1 Tax=Paenibacillus piri TaxID=2547395 RepID=A0A4R5KA60_9BACL|nr:hypothetical protein [Paenibacillus piri]TDF90582.1 hypothetical protein E1757_33730 [Paenibacillus piri]